MQEVEGYSEAGAPSERDWTKGSVIRNLLSLSWPIVASNVLHLLGPIVPMIWVGRLGAASIAGLGVANSVAALLTVSGMMGFTIGARAIIARFVGAGDTSGANHVARQAFIVSATYGAVVTATGIIFTVPILNLFRLETDVVAEGAAYMRIIFTGSIIVCLRYMAEGIMQASGDAVTPMKIAALFRILHALLCPFLILGWWIFTPLGISGAAIIDIASHGLGLVVIMWVLLSGRSRLKLTLRDFYLDLNTIWRIVRIGIPASVMSIQTNLGGLMLTRLMVPFGTLAVAAHSIVQRINMILERPSISLGMAAGVLVGQNLGAGQPERAEKSGWLGVSLVEGFMLICAVAILLWAESIVRIFTHIHSIIEITGVFLRIAVAGYLVLGFSAVLQHSISGAGDAVPPMLISLLMIWVIQLPLAFLLPQVTNLDVYGVRWAMVIGLVVGAVAYTIYFHLGRWKRKKV